MKDVKWYNWVYASLNFGSMIFRFIIATVVLYAFSQHIPKSDIYIPVVIVVVVLAFCYMLLPVWSAVVDVLGGRE